MFVTQLMRDLLYKSPGQQGPIKCYNVKIGITLYQCPMCGKEEFLLFLGKYLQCAGCWGFPEVESYEKTEVPLRVQWPFPTWGYLGLSDVLDVYNVLCVRGVDLSKASAVVLNSDTQMYLDTGYGETPNDPYLVIPLSLDDKYKDTTIKDAVCKARDWERGVREGFESEMTAYVCAHIETIPRFITKI